MKTHKKIFLLSHQKRFPISKEKHLCHASQREGSRKGHRRTYWVCPFATGSCTTPKGGEWPKPWMGFFIGSEWEARFGEVKSVDTHSVVSPKVQVKASLLLADEIKPGQILHYSNTALEWGSCHSKNQIGRRCASSLTIGILTESRTKEAISLMIPLFSQLLTYKKGITFSLQSSVTSSQAKIS